MLSNLDDNTYKNILVYFDVNFLHDNCIVKYLFYLLYIFCARAYVYVRKGEERRRGKKRERGKILHKLIRLQIHTYKHVNTLIINHI